MLVLTRKIGQKLIIADNIEVVILDARGDSVKIGVNAPKNVSIYREEIYTEIKKANKLAGQQIKTDDLDSAFNLIADKKPRQFDFFGNVNLPPINKPEK